MNNNLINIAKSAKAAQLTINKADTNKKNKMTSLSKVFGKLINTITSNNTKVIIMPIKRGSSTRELDRFCERVRSIIKSWVKPKSTVLFSDSDRDISRDFIFYNRIYYGDNHPNSEGQRAIAEALLSDVPRDFWN